MKFYLLAEAVCDECDNRIMFRVNKDKTVWHECNRGNVETPVPQMEFNVKPLKKNYPLKAGLAR